VLDRLNGLPARTRVTVPLTSSPNEEKQMTDAFDRV